MRLAYSAFLVRDYDEAVAWFTKVLDWEVREDTDLGSGKRWIRVGARNGGELLLARAATPSQHASIGEAAAGRVAYFLHSDDFDRDWARLAARGLCFAEAPRDEAYGRVAVFRDLYGNKWDLVGPASVANAIGENA